MTDLRDHDAPIWALTMAGIRIRTPPRFRGNSSAALAGRRPALRTPAPCALPRRLYRRTRRTLSGPPDTAALARPLARRRGRTVSGPGDCAASTAADPTPAHT